MTHSFRSKLAKRATIGVAFGLVAVSAVTLFTLRTLLDRELNASILSVASIQAASLADGVSGEMHFHEWDLTAEEAASVQDLIRYAQVWQVDGQSLLRSQFMTTDLPFDATGLTLASSGELVWAEQNFEGSPVRTLYYPLERLGEAHRTHVLQIAAPLISRNGMLARTAVFLSLLTIGLAGGTFLGSWWLAGRAVLPIHEVIDQAEAIGAGSLDHRIRAYADTREYRRLVEVLNTMLSRIEGSVEVQRRFTADASHELRSPLTAMRGEIELALRRPRESEEYRAVLESNLEEVVRLSRITENLLTLARSDAGALTPMVEQVDAGQVVSKVVGRLRPLAEEKGITVGERIESPCPAVLDPALLSQIAWNLTDNALKFTPSGGRVSVVVQQSMDEVVLQVEDSGTGFGETDPAAAFERFFRRDSARTRSSETEGTGLGLAIVKAVAEAHGGEAWAENRPDGGARFSVRIPITTRVVASGNGPSRA